MTERVGQAESLLKQNKAACVVISRDAGVTESQKSGIAPLLEWLNGSPDLLKGACVADKVVGRAAALLMVYGGVAEVYAGIISESAAECLKQNGIPFSFGQKVSYVQNRDKTGMCPMERRCLPVRSPSEAYTVLNQMVMEHSGKMQRL